MNRSAFFARFRFLLKKTLLIMRISNRLTVLFGLTTLAILPCPAAPQAEKPMMKAVIIHEYGGPEVLKLEDVPRPEPKENEVLVRVIAAGVNPVDALIRSGKYAKFFGTTLTSHSRIRYRRNR